MPQLLLTLSRRMVPLAVKFLTCPSIFIDMEWISDRLDHGLFDNTASPIFPGISP